ncbi:MAG: LysM peptidoglycan-binding domain-containing protein [Treponemataceae bacterium]|nr:LysM peptidoglycan-binding domain-containing protein [Treponemataceae bacterium]
MSCTIFKRAILSVSVAAASLAVAETTHIVQKGETLYSLSRTYGTTVQAICAANGIADGSSVRAGQKLTIPDTKQAAATEQRQTAGGSYTVEKGDTWYGIARRFGTNVNKLYELNGVDSTATLKVGQTVIVPGGTVAAVTNPVKPSPDTPKNGGKISLEDPRTYSDKKGDPSLAWPVQSPSVTYIEGKISGVNLSAKKDEPVTAIRAGTVMFSGTYRGFGNVVFIQSKTGHIYAYTGLGTVKVSKGDYCVFGAQIGTAGLDSYTAKPQMSLMVFQNGLPIDPAKAPRG